MIAQGIVNTHVENLAYPQHLARAENQILGAGLGFTFAAGCLASSIVAAQSPSGGGVTVALIICTMLSSALSVFSLSSYLHERRNPQAIPQPQVVPQAQANPGGVPDTLACSPTHAGDLDNLNHHSLRTLRAALSNIPLEHLRTQSPLPAVQPNSQPEHHIV
jgi:hypothetical protein